MVLATGYIPTYELKSLGLCIIFRIAVTFCYTQYLNFLHLIVFYFFSWQIIDTLSSGTALEDWDSSPPCMADDIFRCMGKATHVALCSIARHLRLLSE